MLTTSGYSTVRYHHEYNWVCLSCGHRAKGHDNVVNDHHTSKKILVSYHSQG